MSASMLRIRYFDGYSESLWKSLAVKAMRLGWPAGLEAAAERLEPSTVRSLLVCGVFEDVFPAKEEIEAVRQEIEGRDYEALCRRQTHHGRGLTPAFCALERVACAAARDSRKNVLFAEGKRLGFALPPRSLNCFYTWFHMAPHDAGAVRAIDPTPFRGIPLAMADAHTIEGKRIRQEVTSLSGHYHQHARIAERVQAEGWEPLRRETHGAFYRNKKDQVQATQFPLAR